MVFPFTVGVTPGVSVDDADEDEVSCPEEKEFEFLLLLVKTSFRTIALPWVSLRGGGTDDAFESIEGLESWDVLGVPDFSVAKSPVDESDLLKFAGSLRGINLEVLLSETGLGASDCELLLKMLDFLLFGTSWSRNLSPEDCPAPAMAKISGEFAIWTLVSSPLIAGEAVADGVLFEPPGW
jgi:hypothetical protein